MINLKVLKNKKSMNKHMVKKRIKAAFTYVLLFGTVLSCAGPVIPVLAGTGEMISIEKPSGWKQGETTIAVTVDDSNLGEGITISKIEAKVGDDGSWMDITSNRSITISQNTTVYVRITDSAGTTYEQNRSIRCYDSEKPTLIASLTDGVLTIQGQDQVSGIQSITVNGTEYTDLKDGQLKIQLTQKDFTTKQIEISAKDGAGNESDMYFIQNPYYEWAVKQAIAQSSDSENNSTGQSSGGEQTETTAPLPQDSTPSEPTTSTGTVTERTVTGIEKELQEKNETVDTISSTTTEGGKEFYTISTKSGKVFYLVIDNDQSQDNVYFLTEVDEKDLMNFTLSDTVELPAVDTVYATVGEEEETAVTPTPEPTVTPEEEVEMPAVRSGIGSYILIGLLAAGAGAGAWYMKIYKPKHEFDDMDEYEEEEESEVVNEDSQNNSSLQNPGYETLDLDDLEREARIRKVMEDDEGEEDEE